MPPELWAVYVWRLIHGIMQVLDDIEMRFTILEIATMLRAISSLLPCPDCSQHFRAYLKQEFHNLKHPWPPSGYFLWSVETRSQIARRLGRPVRDVDYCLQNLKDPEFYGAAWNALSVISFSYPTEVSEEMSNDVHFLFSHMLPLIFPNANRNQWISIVPKDKKWTLSKEYFINVVYELRTKCQENPRLVIVPLATLQQQWFHTVDIYIQKFNAEQQKRNPEMIKRNNRPNIPLKTKNTVAYSYNQLLSNYHHSKIFTKMQDRPKNVFVPTNHVISCKEKNYFYHGWKELQTKQGLFWEWVYQNRSTTQEQFGFCAIIILALLICLAVLWFLLIGIRDRWRDPKLHFQKFSDSNPNYEILT